MSLMMKLLRDRRGTAAMELGLILALIVIGMFGALNGLGSETTSAFSATAHKVIEATH